MGTIRYTVRIPKTKKPKKVKSEPTTSTTDDFINQPYPQPKQKVHLPVVQQEARDEVSVAVEETRAGAMPLLDQRARESLAGEYAKLKQMPRQVCNSCHVSSDCPEFKVDYVCAYEKMLQALPVRNVDDVKAHLVDAFENTAERLRFARLMERLVEGGQTNDRVTRLNDQLFNLGERLIDLTSVATKTTVTLSGPRNGDPAASSGGVMSRLFGGLPKGSPDTMMLQAPQTIVDEIREEEATELAIQKHRALLVAEEDEEDAEGDERVQDSAE